MPPKPSLPLRDGRLSSSSSALGSSQQHNEPYYSNEDIRLLHEIVTTAEEIFPSLPERDRLPTNALFQAAEQVMPAHGYDPDHAPSNISRLIFKIGGRRSEGSLMDKFSSVLEGMGINLEIVESSEQEPQLDSSPTAKTSPTAADSLQLDQTGTFPISTHYDGRRRRNSESAAPTAPTEDLREAPTPFSNRARSVSFGSFRGWEESPELRGAGDENRPPFPRVQGRRKTTGKSEGGDVGEQDSRPLPLRHRPLVVREDETDDGFAHRRHNVEDYPETESEHVDEDAPSDVYEGDFSQDSDLPRAHGAPDHFAGTTDTTAQTSAALAASPVLLDEDRDAMEEDLRAFQDAQAYRGLDKSLSTWRHVARNTSQRHRHLEAQAVAIDKNDLLSDFVAEWRESAERSKAQRLAAQGPFRDSAEDARWERIATRACDYFLMFKAFTHWEACAQEELRRTAIARRHMLRRRYFSAWRSHQADIEAKIHTFRIGSLLHVWRRTAIHHEVRGNVAVQRYHHNLVKDVFETWYDEYRARLADDLWTCRLKEHCMMIWQVETRRRAASYEDCLFYDQRFLQENAIATWREVTQELRTVAYGRNEQKIIWDLRRVFEDWRAQANLNMKFRAFTEERNRRSKGLVIGHWMSKTREADQRALVAKTLVIRQFITHWRNEAKLKKFKLRGLRDLKFHVLSHWRSEQKLASYERLCERRAKEEVLGTLRMEADESRTRAVRRLHLADSLVGRSTKAAILGPWRSRTAANLQEKVMAEDRHFVREVTSCLRHWYIRAGEEAARTADLKRFADRGAYYVATSNTLAMWAEITKQARRERLTGAYHTFRRKYKVTAATKCLLKWRGATRDSHALSYDADTVYGAHLRDDLAGYVQFWRDRANTIPAILEVAKGAEQEVWWGKWSARAKDLRDTDLDAADYASDQTLSRCWRAWEFATLQNKGKQHVAVALQENNDKKFCRQILAQWSQKSAPDAAHRDMRSSVMSRRSTRHGNFLAVETPRFGSSVTSQPRVQLLPDIEEDLGDIYNATPSFKREYGRASEATSNPFLSSTKGLSQSLPQRPRGYSKHDLPPIAAAPQPPFSSLPISTDVPPPHFGDSVYANAQRQPSQRHYQQDTPRPRPGIAQQPAVADFDEDDISFAPSEGNDYPATFMSTPTRWTGTARSLSAAPPARNPPQKPPYRRPASVIATTTPSAVLDSPFERALRREYGGGMLARDRRSVVGGERLTTPRVTFEDIREESGEGLYDERGEER